MKHKVLITGGGSGIGLALACKFMGNGHTVVVTGRNLAKLNAVITEFPDLHIVQSDVTNKEDVLHLVELMEQQFGGIDVLVNNAGIMNLVDAGDEENDLQHQFDEIAINYEAPVRMLHYFLPQLKRSKHAVLINVSSGLAYVAFSQAPVYSGTKSALHFWTQAIRPQLRPHRIRVVELLPPVVDTKLAQEADLKDDKLKPMPTQELAEKFWKDYVKGKEEIVPGLSKQLRLMSRIAPKFIFNQLNKDSIPRNSK